MTLSTFMYNVSLLLSKNNTQEINSKININSPGDIIYLISNTLTSTSEFIQNNLTSILVIYIFVFGCKYKDIEFFSLLSLAREFSNFKETKKDNYLSRSEKEVEILTKEINNIKELSKIENLDEAAKKYNELKKLYFIEDNYKKIYNSSAILDIKESTNVISIKDIINKKLHK